jgi:ATP diphosphatase
MVRKAEKGPGLLAALPLRQLEETVQHPTQALPMPDTQTPPADPAEGLANLIRIMARLRDPACGCPWDLEQTFATIAPYTIEEAYEVADAIERADMVDLRDELGDLLFQVIFHSRMAQEAGAFTLADVIAAINDKMIRRHPHVFEAADGRDAKGQVAAWEEMKAAERAARGTATRTASALDGVAVSLPALVRAEKLQKRAARTGFDWTHTPPIFDKLTEEVGEVKAAMAAGDADAIEDEVGDLLFVAANLARRLSVDPEQALRRANAKFERRFRAMETAAAAEGVDFTALSLDAQEAYWQRVKMEERA